MSHWMKPLLLFVTLFIFICVPAQKKNIDLLRGDSLLGAGKFSESIPFYEKALKANSKNEMALRGIGYAYSNLGNYELGAKFYKEAIVVNPNCARCYLNLGNIRWAKQDLAGASEYFTQAIQLDKGDAFLYSRRAAFRESQGDKFGALSDHNKAIELDPKNANYHSLRSAYNSRMGYVPLALSDIGKAIELQPSNAGFYLERAELYYGRRMIKEALEDINKGLTLDSNMAALYTGRGAIYSSVGERQLALKDYSKSLALSPDDHLTLYDRGLEKYHLEDMDGSCDDIVKAYKIAMTTDPSDPNLAKMELSINDYCDSSKASYYYQRGIACYNIGKYDASIQAYSRGLTKFNSGMMYCFRGNAYMMAKDPKKAVSDYRKSLFMMENVKMEFTANPRYKDANPDSVNRYLAGFQAEIYQCAAQCYAALKEFPAALRAIDSALLVYPNGQEGLRKENYYNIRGNILFATGKYAEAIKDFDAAIRYNPRFDLAYLNRALAKLNTEVRMVPGDFILHGSETEPFNLDWILPADIEKKKIPAPLLQSAVSDCDKALSLNKELAYIYYVRSYLMRYLSADFCKDLDKAEQLGFPVQKELTESCK